MVTKAVKTGAVIALVLVIALGVSMMSTGRLAQRDIRSSGIDSATDVARAYRVNGNGSHSTGGISSSDYGASVDTRKKAVHVAANALGLRSKGGGGEIAVFTFLILLGLWCFRGWWIAGRTLLHR